MGNPVSLTVSYSLGGAGKPCWTVDAGFDSHLAAFDVILTDADGKYTVVPSCNLHVEQLFDKEKNS
jgi:hypothetical protein